MYGLGGVLGALSLLGGGIVPADAPIVWASVAAALLGAGVLAGLRDALPAWWPHVAAPVAATICAISVWFDVSARSALESAGIFMMLWVALFIGVFLGRRSITPHLAYVVALLLVVVVHAPTPDGWLASWSVLAGSFLVASVTVRAQRGRLEDGLRRETLAARTDALTGLANRRELAERFDHEQERALRHGTPLALLVADLDHFKAVNDRHGHEQGDRVLRAVGQVLAEQCRSVDVVARLGGEEFAVLMPNTDLEGATDVAERLRRHVGRALAASPVPVTMSLGVAACPLASDLGGALRAADAALYDAKRRGRDRVAVALAA
jgi:diguanylate cyclase (GGDEF)-like protein